MNHEEHKARHGELHEGLDELLADYLRWHREIVPATVTCLELMLWSITQAEDPIEDPDDTAHSYAVCSHCGELVTNAATHMCPAEQMEHGR